MLTHRSVFPLCILFLSTLPALASQPDGYAAELIKNDANASCGLPAQPGFTWGQPFGQAIPLDPTDTLRLDFAIIPFRDGPTDVILFEGVGHTGFVEVTFLDGSVAGLPYNRSTWNDVRVEIRLATQDYVVVVNGAQSVPIAFPSYFCPSGCFSIEGFALEGGDALHGGVAWFDSSTLIRTSATGNQVIFDFNADPCYTQTPRVTGGGLAMVLPPARLRPRK